VCQSPRSTSYNNPSPLSSRSDEHTYELDVALNKAIVWTRRPWHVDYSFHEGRLSLA
jgi:hypothetical protein